MRLVSFGSGSCGNSIYAGNDKTHFLVDVGISRKRIVEGLGQMGIEPEQLSGIFITHEHMDHINGLGVFLRKYRIPVYATGKTIDKILETEVLGEFPTDLFASIEPDTPTNIGGVTVEASHIYHDAAEPVCYSFTDENDKVGIATDFGTFTDYLVEKMLHCSSLIVEANHDLNMLMVGPYPYPLKQRIMGNNGHLSNERAGQFLSKVIGEECRHILLGHLSKENNYGELAYETVKVELYAHNIRIEEEPFTLKVAARDAVTFCGEEAEGESDSE